MNPRARQFSPIRCPCLRKSFRSPVANTSDAEGAGRERFAEAVDASAFEIDAGKERSRHALLAIAQKAPCLLGSPNVAREQNHSRGLQPLEQGTEARRHLSAVEADDQELADMILGCHGVGFSRSDGGRR